MKSETPEHLRASLTAVAPRLADVILRCLERNRERRFASVSELAMALVAYGSDRAPTYVERIARSGRHAAGAPSDATPSPRVLPLPEVGKTLPSPIARSPVAAAKSRERRARRPVVVGATGIAVVLLALWASASWRAPSGGPASDKAAALTSTQPIAANVEAIAESPHPTVVDASSQAAIASISLAPEVTAPKRADVRVRPPAPSLVESTKAPAPKAPASNGRREDVPSTRTGSPASDGEWAPPDVQK